MSCLYVRQVFARLFEKLTGGSYLFRRLPRSVCALACSRGGLLQQFENLLL